MSKYYEMSSVSSPYPSTGEICEDENKRLYISNNSNRPFQSSPGPLYQNEVKCSAFDMEITFHSHVNKAHFQKNGCAIGLILKVRVFGTRKWPISEIPNS